MNSLILQTASRLLNPLLLLFSIYLLARGHNAPGGGFAGGLIAAAAFTLHVIAYDVTSAQQILRINPHYLIGIGLLFAAGSGLPSLLIGRAFMKGLWTEVVVPGLGKLDLGTPLMFDTGVYLLVLGITLMIIFPLSEE